jgi:hypothetical protein
MGRGIRETDTPALRYFDQAGRLRAEHAQPGQHGTISGQRAALTLKELSKFSQPSVGVAPHPTFTFIFECVS